MEVGRREERKKLGRDGFYLTLTSEFFVPLAWNPPLFIVNKRGIFYL